MSVMLPCDSMHGVCDLYSPKTCSKGFRGSFDQIISLTADTQHCQYMKVDKPSNANM